MSQLGGGISRFFGVFFGSAAIGILVALLSSLVLKHIDLYTNPSLEFALMLCFIYTPYALAEGVHLSGKISKMSLNPKSVPAIIFFKFSFVILKWDILCFVVFKIICRNHVHLVLWSGDVSLHSLQLVSRHPDNHAADHEDTGLCV